MAMRLRVVGLRSISAMQKHAAIETKTMRDTTATNTWIRWGIDQQSAGTGRQAGRQAGGGWVGGWWGGGGWLAE